MAESSAFGVCNREYIKVHRAQLAKGYAPIVRRGADIEDGMMASFAANVDNETLMAWDSIDGLGTESDQSVGSAEIRQDLGRESETSSHHEGMWSRKALHRRIAEHQLQQAAVTKNNGTQEDASSILISATSSESSTETADTSSTVAESSAAAASTSQTTATSSAATTSSNQASRSSPTSTATSTSTTSSTTSTLSSSSSAATTAFPSVQRVAAATTTKKTSTVCAPTYVGATMISGTGTLPKPTSFVKRMPSGWGLGLEGKSFRIAGYNIYWLCNNEDVLPKGQKTSHQRVREAMAIAVAGGANTWDQPDYVLYAAREYGLRVILPLTDNYNYYHGGKYDFLWWKKVSTINFGERFYSDNNAIASYKAYIYQMMNRVNQYTGVRYGDDPTILAWETGNELGAYLGTQGYPPLSWTNNIAKYIKSMSKQLVIDGSDGFYSWSTRKTAPGLQSPYIDIMTDHAYPRNISLLNEEVPLMKKYNKNFLIGEWDWTNNNGGSTIDDYIKRVESSYFFGSMVWSIFGHDDKCCAFLPHNDGYTIYYPNGNSPIEQINILKVVQHFYRSAGLV
ncbi:hypothetical protein OIO90_004943 [Microbotryomycetes sp. JL221]|nr:hypothetical protein OIO90_004943 [Microbotryomycetes sp. JL221]